MIKCRLQAMQETSALKGAASSERVGPWRLTRSIIVNEGPLAPFKGLSAAIVREMIGYFCFFGVYEMVRESYVQPGQTKDDIGKLEKKLCCIPRLSRSSPWVVQELNSLVKSESEKKCIFQRTGKTID